MSPQQMDLRRSASILKRRKRLIGAVAIVGIAAGAVFAAVSPPLMSAKALVVLPGAAPNVATEVVIASSNPVLQDALPYVSPQMSVTQFRKQVQVTNLSSDILQVTTEARSAAQAEANTTAVVNSYISYIGSTSSPVGRLNVRVLQAANTATGTAPLLHWLVSALIGGLGGALIGVIAALATGRRDRRLRTRDDIANAIGVPVLASLPVAQPSTAAEWNTLLTGYRPRPVYAWRLRKTLQQLTLAGVNLTGAKASSVTVLTLTTDPKSLALGPQLAAYAASQGILTRLVTGQGQDSRISAALLSACAAVPEASANLRLTVATAGDIEPPDDDSGFTVVTAVIDGSAPRAGGIMHTDATVLGVSAGGATADQIALTAVVAASDGREIAGVLVADPDPEDHTTGRIPNLVRPRRRTAESEPVEVSGTVTEARR